MTDAIDITWDVEANNLLNQSSIDYTASPYKLKDSFKLHCIVVEEHGGDIVAFYNGPTYVLDGRSYAEVVEGKEYVLENYEAVVYIHKQLDEFPEYVKNKKIRRVIGHNIINFDLLAVKLYFMKEDMDYTICPDTWCGKSVDIVDTFALSKTLNPDRFEGHSLDALSAKTGVRKVNFRPHMKHDEKFLHFAADMLYYNIYDCKANTAVWKWLEREKGGWNWNSAIELEKYVLDIITRQEHRGFNFDKELAESNVRELDALMEEKRQKIEPILPARPATQAFLKEHTPPAKPFVKSGALSSHMEKFIAKHGGRLIAPRKVELYGKEYDLPLTEPIKTEMDAKITDTTHIKNWLVGLGWQPMEYKEKDLSVDPKKQKLPMEKFHETVKRYVDQTLASNFCKDRCEYLKTTPDKLLNTLLGKFGKGCKVITNPSFTVGQEKNPCPNLLEMSEQFPYAKDIIEYMTYRHRRNSILGGGADWDDDEEPEKGYLSSIREDGRIPTPADTCGAACVHPETLIITDKGVVPIVSVNVGDLVLTHTGRYKRVAAKVDNGIKPILRITSNTGLQLRCTENHPLLTPTGWKRADELRVGEEVFVYPEKESWGQVAGLSNYYISSWGRVITSFGNVIQHLPRKALWDRANIDVIADDGSKHRYGVGCLVLSAFVEPRPEGLECRHVDGNPCNNNVRNLRWGTSEENSQDARVHGRTLRSARDRAKLTREEVNQIKEHYLHFGYTRGDDTRLSKMYNCSREHIRDIRIGKRWSDALSEENDYTESFMRVTVEAITSEGISPTYDITVEEDHSYIADGYVTHNTSRMKHRLVANIPRVTSLYGDKMRALFGVDRSYCYQIGYDFASLEARMEAHYCHKYECDPREYCKSLLLEKPNDVHSITAKKISAIIGRDFPRSTAKNVKYGCTYGAQEAKVAKTIGADLKTGKIVFDAFWEAALPLKLLKDKLKIYWETVGDKRFILGIDGRKVPTRSAHAILNSLFQSAGVICAKRAMVIHDRKLKQHGLWIDFFKDDWKNKLYCQQLIAYHK